MVISTGLKCGLIKATHDDMDMTPFDPTIRFPHSPFVKVEVATVKRFWDYLIYSLRKMPSN